MGQIRLRNRSANALTKTLQIECSVFREGDVCLKRSSMAPAGRILVPEEAGWILINCAENPVLEVGDRERGERSLP
jgi:hypothetical protein